MPFSPIHLIRHAIWALRHDWDKTQAAATRITKVADWLRYFGGWAEVEKFIDISGKKNEDEPSLFSVLETASNFGGKNVDIPF